MWSGDIFQIPGGWTLCNGGTYTDSQGQPIQTTDLKNRFIVAADTQGEYGQGQSGDYKIDISNQSFTPSADGSRTHKFSPQWYNKGAKDGGDRTIIDMGRPPRYSIRDSSTRESGQHSHDVKIQSNHNGGNSQGDLCPPWYALAFIMKL